MYKLSVNTGSLDWTPLDFPGVSMKILRTDEATGGMTVLTKLDGGAAIPRHRHTQADETAFVVSGDLIEDGEEFGAGHFFSGPAGTSHGPHGSKNGCVFLTTFSAELDFVVDEEVNRAT